MSESIRSEINRFRLAKRSQWLLILLKLAISATLLTLVVRYASWERLSIRFAEISALHLALAFLPFVAVSMCVGLRWKIIGTAVARRLSFAEAWVVSMIGSGLDQILITLSGDAYRTWRLNKGSPSLTRALAGVLLDRVAGVLGIVLLVLIFLPRLAALDGIGALLWVPILLAFGALSGFMLLLMLDRIPMNLSLGRLLGIFALMSGAARMVFLRPKSAIPALTAAVMVHIGASATISALGWAMGVTIPLLSSLTVVPTAILITLLPISVGGWGVREGVMIVALGLIGVAQADAVVISILFGLSSLTVGLLGVVMWLLGLPVSAPPTAGEPA